MILQAVDKGLRVLDADADGKGFRLEADATGLKNPVDIAGRVAGREDDRPSLEQAPISCNHTVDTTVGQDEIHHPAPEVDLPSRLPDALPQGADHVGQEVGADVRMRVDEDAFRSAMGDQGPVDLRHRPALGRPGVEFSIRESAGPALPETVVGVLDNLASPEDRAQVEAAARDILAPLEHDRLQTRLEAAQRRKKAGRTASHDDDPRRPGLDFGIGRLGVPGNRFRPVQPDLEPKLDLDQPPTGVDRVLAQFQSGDPGLGDAEMRGNRPPPGNPVLRLLERQDDVDHLDLRTGHQTLSESPKGRERESKFPESGGSTFKPGASGPHR